MENVIERLWKPEEMKFTKERFVEWFDGFFCGAPINFGANHKLDKTCARSSNEAGTTCPPECSDPNNPQACYYHGCYAAEEEGFRPSVHDKDIAMTYLVLNDVPKLERYIRRQLDKRPKYVTSQRVHERGDFANQEEVDMWARIARDYPSLKFYCYTKWRDSEGNSKYNWEEFDKYATWHPSDIHGLLNYGPVEYIEELHRMFPKETYVCQFHKLERPCGTLHGSCQLCMDMRLSGMTPLFAGHGKGIDDKTKDFMKILKDYKENNK